MSKHILNIDELDYMDWGHGEKFGAKFGVIIELEGGDSAMPEFWRLMMKGESTQVDYWEGED